MSSEILATCPAVEYRNVPGFPGYRVGDDGSVWSIWGKGRSPARANPRAEYACLAPGVASNGYFTVSLSRGNGCETRTVHSLVLESFIGPPPDGQLSRHKNGVYSDCRLGNLEYGTQFQNMQDAIGHGVVRRGFDLPQTKLSDRDVEIVIELVALGVRQNAIAMAFDISVSHVSYTYRGLRTRPRKRRA